MTLPYLRKEMRIYQPDHYPMDLDTFNQMKAGVLPKVCPLCGMTFNTLHGMTRHFIYKRCRKNILPPNMEFEEIKDETKEKGFKYICKVGTTCSTIRMEIFRGGTRPRFSSRGGSSLTEFSTSKRSRSMYLHSQGDVRRADLA